MAFTHISFLQVVSNFLLFSFSFYLQKTIFSYRNVVLTYHENNFYRPSFVLLNASQTLALKYQKNMIFFLKVKERQGAVGFPC